jgi:hypothetical protein
MSVGLVQDLGDPDVRGRIQEFLDTQGGHPVLDVEEEYPHYFEAVYPSEADRRRYIDQQISGASPSIGHRALAALVAAEKVRVIWTTNFDRLPEDATIRVLGASGRVTVASLDNPKVASDALNEGRWPLVGKLHGDFQSRRLKNTPDELRAQDAELRRAFLESCRRFGLAVVGYSGRDGSVMDSLEEAIADGRGFPHGLFWFHRTGSLCTSRVYQLIEKASSAGVDAHLVESETFDELIADLTLLHTDISQNLVPELDRRAQRLSPAPKCSAPSNRRILTLSPAEPRSACSPSDRMLTFGLRLSHTVLLPSICTRSKSIGYGMNQRSLGSCSRVWLGLSRGNDF